MGGGDFHRGRHGHDEQKKCLFTEKRERVFWAKKKGSSFHFHFFKALFGENSEKAEPARYSGAPRPKSAYDILSKKSDNRKIMKKASSRGRPRMLAPKMETSKMRIRNRNLIFMAHSIPATAVSLPALPDRLAPRARRIVRG